MRLLSRMSISRNPGLSVDNKNAPADAENTEKSRGAFIPKVKAIEKAKINNRMPLNKAKIFVFQPRISAIPKIISNAVAIIAATLVIESDRNGTS